MAQILKYKNLLNQFVDYSKSYALDTKNQLSTMVLNDSMGLTEELMNNRIFFNGNLGSTNTNMVGVPHKIIDDIVTKYTQLKSNINSETTLIQTQLNTLTPNNKEKEYIKNSMLNSLEDKITNITSSIMSTVNSFRTQQTKLVDVVDMLNMITVNSYDGQFVSKTGGMVKAFQLTGTTELNKLTTDYSATSHTLRTYLHNYVLPNFTKNYPGGGEYLFFTNTLCTNECLNFNFSGSYKTELVKIMKYRDSKLYDKLINVDENCVNGIRLQTQRSFKYLLNKIVIKWTGYDISLIRSRLDNGIYEGYTYADSNLVNFITTYDVEYGINSGTTAQNIVRQELKNRNIGVNNGNFNHKKMKQLYIS